MSENELLPRLDLREPAFRKYEHDIAAIASRKELKIPFTKLIEMRMKPSTYCTRFRDAIRGYKLYGYKSTLIPAGARLDQIAIHETTDGGVLLVNKSQQQNSVTLSASSWDLVLSLCEKITNNEISGAFTISYQTKEELDRLISLAHFSSPYNVGVDPDEESKVVILR